MTINNISFEITNVTIIKIYYLLKFATKEFI